MPTNRLVSVSFHFPSKSMKTRFSFSGAGLPGMPTPGSWWCPVITSGCHSPLGIWVGGPTAHIHKRHGDLHSKAYFRTVFHFLSEYQVWASWWLHSKESTCQCRRHGFNPWVRKIPWRRKMQSTPIYLPGGCHAQRSLAGDSSWGRKRVRHNLVIKPKRQ